MPVTLSEVVDVNGDDGNGAPGGLLSTGLVLTVAGSLTTLANGTNGQVLTMVTGSPAWAAAVGGGGYATIERPNGTPVTQRLIMSLSTEFTATDNVDTTDIALATAGVGFSKLANGLAVSVLGVTGGSDGVMASIQASGSDVALRRSGGGGLSFGTLSYAHFADFDASRRWLTTAADIGLRQTGAASSDSRFMVEDFGARLVDETVDLVFLHFQGSATTRTITFEGRSSDYKAGSPSWHIGNSSTSNPTLAIGDNIVRSHQHLNLSLFSASYANMCANGLGVIGIGAATTVPTTNPSGGAILYVDGSGNLLCRTSAGNVRTVAAV